METTLHGSKKVKDEETLFNLAIEKKLTFGYASETPDRGSVALWVIGVIAAQNTFNIQASEHNRYDPPCVNLKVHSLKVHSVQDVISGKRPMFICSCKKGKLAERNRLSAHSFYGVNR